MERIKRCLDIEFRASQEDERTIEGYASVFNEETQIYPWLFEKIDRHAFDDCDMSNVYLLMNHDDNIVLAGTPNNSLELSVDDKGLRIKAKVVETSQGNDYLKLVKDGLIRKMSFGFTIDRDHGSEWYEDAEGNSHRTILKINKLYDASIVTFPAYEGTSVRSTDELDEDAKKHLEERKEMQNKENREKETHEEVTEEVTQIVEETTTNEVEENNEVVEESTTEVVEETIDEESNEDSDVQEEGEERMNTNFENVEKRKDEKLESKPEYAKAYRKACMGDDKEFRMLTSDMENAPIPTYMQGKVETAWEKATTIISRVTQISVRGIVGIPYEVDADEAVVHDEGTEAPSEEVLTLGQTLLQPVAIKKWISYSDILEAMTDEQFMDYLVDEVVYRTYKKLNDSIIVGGTDSAGKGVIGVVNSPLTLKREVALGFNSFNEADAELIDGNESVVVMNKKTFMKNVLGLVDTTGRPIFTQTADLNGKALNLAGGRTVIFNNKLKDYDSANAGDVWAVVGDLSAYKLNLPMGKDVNVIKDIKGKEDKEEITGKIIAAGDVTRLDNLIALKKPQA